MFLKAEKREQENPSFKANHYSLDKNELALSQAELEI